MAVVGLFFHNWIIRPKVSLIRSKNKNKTLHGYPTNQKIRRVWDLTQILVLKSSSLCLIQTQRPQAQNSKGNAQKRGKNPLWTKTVGPVLWIIKILAAPDLLILSSVAIST